MLVSTLITLKFWIKLLQKKNLRGPLYEIFQNIHDNGIPLQLFN